jgi:CheY-like chemotaxis protein
VYGIVKQAGGWIAVESQPGTGTTFRIGLPLLPEAEAEALPPGSALAQLEGSETVLVVEDQEEVRNLAVTALRSFHYRTLEAGSGDAALAVVASHPEPIHLVLTDVVMPGMNGRQFAERLRVIRPEIKVLYMSGYPAEVVSRRGLLDSGAECILKPFTPETLAGRIRGILGVARQAAKVLVVDDDPAIRDLLTEILKSDGYEVEVACDGLQASRILKSGHFDLVITDLVMPNAEGLETIQEIRRNYPGLRVIALSGAFGGNFLNIASMLGASATLQKPVGPDQLLATVHEVLR